MPKDLDNLNLEQFSDMSFLDKVMTLAQYQEKHQFAVFPAWENVEPPYSLGAVNEYDDEDIDALGLLQNAKYIYLLAATTAGRPAVLEFDYKNCLCITLSRHLVCDEEYEGFFNMIAEQNKISRDDLYLCRCNLRFLQAQMNLFKCTTCYLIHADGWYNISDFELEKDETWGL